MRSLNSAIVLTGCSIVVAQLSNPIADDSHISVDGNRFLQRSADPARTEWPYVTYHYVLMPSDMQAEAIAESFVRVAPVAKWWFISQPCRQTCEVC